MSLDAGAGKLQLEKTGMSPEVYNVCEKADLLKFHWLTVRHQKLGIPGPKEIFALEIFSAEPHHDGCLRSTGG